MTWLYTRETAVIEYFLRAVMSSVFGPEDSSLSVRNDELGSRFFAIDKRCPTAVAVFHPLAIFFQDERIVVVPRSAVYFRIVSALPLHTETCVCVCVCVCDDERDCAIYSRGAL